MRTENSIRGFSSILLAFAIVLSMTLTITFTATPVLATAIVSHPGGTTINVVQGQTFTLSHRMTWQDAANPGYYSVTFYWDYLGDNSTHFTLVENKAYFDNGDPIQAIASIADDGSRYTVGVACTAGDWNDNSFNVDITLRASGPDGTPHVVGTQAITYVVIRCRELIEATAYPTPVTINVQAWPGGVFVRGKEAYNNDATGIPPFIFYDPGDHPPIAAAKQLGDGAFVAAGCVGTCRNGRWNDDSPLNPAPYLDVLFHQAFQWMVSGADNVLWYEGYGVYNDTGGCSDLIDNLTNRFGYAVWGDDTEPISGLDLDNVAILVLPQLQLGYGPGGGDPSLLPAGDVTAIYNFVNGGGGLLIMDGNDTFGYNYNRVHNKILEALDSDWWFQHDEVLDDVNSWYGTYSPICDVDSTTAIGAGYVGVTGTENIGLYSICSLAPVPTFDVDVTISPDERSAGAGEEVTFVATVHNTGDAWDTYTIDLSDDLGWPELSFLPKIATPHIYPTDDSHVCEYYPTNVADGGVDYNMYVGWENNPYATEGWKTRAYLRFDVSGVPSVISATLNAKVRYGPSTGYPSYTPDNMLVDVKAVSDDAWLENELTWDNAPAVGSTLDTTMVYDDGTVGTEVWYSWDVTGFVDNEVAGDGIVSLCMLSEEKENDNTDCTVWFYTKDQGGTSDDPYIEVTYLGLSTTKTVTLGPCQSENFDLGVIIDPASVYCTRDTITVTATSAYTGTVLGSDTAKAHSRGVPLVLRGVTVEIEPDHREAELIVDKQEWQQKRYDPLIFKVIVTNTGKLTDAYILSVADDMGWMLEVVPPELYIDPGKSDIAVVAVTPLENAEGCTTNNIIVTATGKLANGIGDDTENAISDARATVHVKIKRGVMVEILPCQTQTATPGSKLRWVVKIKNLGNVDDEYELSVEQDVSDGEPWLCEIEPEQIVVPLCSFEQAWITCQVPLGSVTSTTNTITVTATSKTEPENMMFAAALGPPDLIPTNEPITSMMPCDWFYVVEGVWPQKCSWWHVIWPPEEESKVFHVDEVLPLVTQGPFFHIDKVDPEQPYIENAPMEMIAEEWVSDSASCSAHVLVPGPRVPNAWIKLTVEAEIIAIQVWPIASTGTNDFGILDEMEEATRGPFTVRNIGNMPVNISITGSDAKSQPGEPIATWDLAFDGISGTDIYAMHYGSPATPEVLKDTASSLAAGVAPGSDVVFYLKMTAPSAITVPARMYTIVTLSAVKAP